MIDDKDVKAFDELLKFFNKAKFELDVKDCVSLTQAYTTCYKMRDKLKTLAEIPAKKPKTRKSIK